MSRVTLLLRLFFEFRAALFSAFLLVAQLLSRLTRLDVELIIVPECPGMDVPGVITISGFVEVCANSRDVSPQCGAFPKLGVAVLLREPSDSRRPFVCKDVSKDESFFGGGSMCVVDARVAAVVIPSSVLGVAFTVCAIEPGLIVGCVVDNGDPGDLVPSAEFPQSLWSQRYMGRCAILLRFLQ